MKTNKTYTNEFTGEIFCDKGDCVRAETVSKIDFINKLTEDIELIKDICNSHNYCEECPFECGGDDGFCVVSPLADKYLDIVSSLRRIND